MISLKKCLNIKFSTVILLFSLIIIKINSFECPKDKPIILENNGCDLLYCTESQFQSNYCIINNTQIKTQWLTNIIIFGDENAKFINFATYSNGDFVVESTPFKVIIAKRFFFGLKQNGRDLFKINDTETQFYSFIPTGEGEGEKYQGEIQIAKMNQENNKEYLLSLSKSDSYAELYDFECGEIYKKKCLIYLEL